eukprot:CAMPEP_0197052856 /NCGR_PEP_ID=MMETSP1384-20130603/27260_1 /TAXON_ID=29189 /ORGANISM="Ammonia sp." /LENGTH=56 /DNA_ID=CAMNT_0042485667 /DNA_START=68 /DNA_END=235 /DNA_ORIENTATION=-
MNCCHLDISLENFVINDATVFVDPATNRIRFSNEITVKLVDFGVAEVFTTTNGKGK